MEQHGTGDPPIVQSPIPPQDVKSLFSVWLGLDDPRRPLEQQFAAACAAYERRFGRSPLVILIGPTDERPSALVGVTLECRISIRPSQYWLRIDAGVELA